MERNDIEAKIISMMVIEKDEVLRETKSKSLIEPRKKAENKVSEGKVAEARLQEGMLAKTKATEGKVSEARMPEGKFPETKVSEGWLSGAKASDGKLPEAKVTEEKQTAGVSTYAKITEGKVIDNKPTEVKARDNKPIEVKASDNNPKEKMSTANKSKDDSSIENKLKEGTTQEEKNKEDKSKENNPIKNKSKEGSLQEDKTKEEKLKEKSLIANKSKEGSTQEDKSKEDKSKENNPIKNNSKECKLKVNKTKEDRIKEDRYWRKDILSELYERKNYLESLISEKEDALQDVPEGQIRIVSVKKSFQYYYKNPSSPKEVYLPKSEIDLAKKLAQKSYNKKIRTKAENELHILEKYIDHLEAYQLFDIYTRYSDGRKELVMPISLTDEQYIQWWKSVQYDHYVIEDKDNYFFTNGGIRVRSKSELMIGNALERFGVPYRYEFPLVLWNNDNVRPDFYCLNVRERVAKVWEHFGKMDDPGYANKNVKKIMDYEQTGFSQGRNFIMTFETSKVALSSKLIDEIIKLYLI